MKDKQRIEELEKDVKDYSSLWRKERDKPRFGWLALGGIVGILIIISVLAVTGYLGSPMGKLHINNDKVVTDYILRYYPEYTNCTINYFEDLDADKLATPRLPGVRVYCDNSEDRDSLEVVRDKSPTKEIAFKDITIEDIFNKEIARYK